MLPWIQCVSKRALMRNEEIDKAVAVQSITTHMVQKRLRWYAHVKRRSDSHIKRTVLGMEVQWVRPRGRPYLRGIYSVKIDIKTNELTDIYIIVGKGWRMALSMATQ